MKKPIYRLTIAITILITLLTIPKFILYGRWINIENANATNDVNINTSDWASEQNISYYLPTHIIFDTIKSRNQFNIGMDTNGKVYAWGDGSIGKLGFGNPDDVYVPTLIPALIDKDIVYFDISNFNALALDANGSLYIWGFAYLGDDTNQTVYGTPTQVSLPSIKFVDAQITRDYIIALSDDGYIYYWGANNYNQGQTTNNTLTPQKITTISNVKQVFAQRETIFALTYNNELYVWGHNEHGNAGIGEILDIDSPTKVEFADNEYVIKMANNDYHSIVLTNLGNVYTWGQNTYGMIGNGNQGNTYYPYLLDVDFIITDVFAGNYASAFKTIDNDIYIWGQNLYGRFGYGNDENSYEPIRMNFIDAAYISIGSNHVMVVNTQGILYGIGRNNIGQFGIPTENEENDFPILITEESYVLTSTDVYFETLDYDLLSQNGIGNFGFFGWFLVAENDIFLYTKKVRGELFLYGKYHYSN